MPHKANKRPLDSPESTQSHKTAKSSNSSIMANTNLNRLSSQVAENQETHNLIDNTDIVSTLRNLLSEELGKERKALLEELDRRFAPVALKTDLQPMQEQLDTLIGDHHSTKSLVSSLQEKIQNFEETLLSQNRKLETMERKQRCKNLIFMNVNKNANAELIQDMCRDVIKASMANIVVEKTQILNVRNELATVLVCFKHEAAIPEIFANVKNLKGSNIRIDYDLSPEIRARRNFLMSLRKEISSKNTDLKVSVHQDTIRIGGKRFIFRERLFLDGDRDASDYLLSNFNINFNLFLDNFITKGKRSDTTS